MRMTDREKAIKMLKSKMDGNTDTSYEWVETVRIAIKALEQESILDKIRAEIHRIYEREGNSSDCLNVLDDLKWFINKCNAESEDKQMEYKEIVIKIPEKDYDNMCRGKLIDTIVVAIKNGIVLPKGHGDLIDKSKIYKAIPAEEDNCTGMGMTYDEMYAYNDGIDAMYNLLQGAKPIIEADKAESEALHMAVKALEQEPAYKVGKWIKQTLIMPLSDSTRDCVMCSECKTHWELEYNFCPNCGAKMESEE